MVVTSPITGAAIIGGELILSLPTGQIINCGLVQGPPGLKGEPGAPGPSSKPGLDGNTLHHGQGFPQSDLGGDGDFYWMTGPDVAVFGPKISGRWGSPVYLKQPIVGVDAKAVPMAMSGVEGGGDGGGTAPTTIYTNRVLPAGSGKLAKRTLRDGKVVVNYPGSPNGILSPSGNLNNQANINGWVVSALEEFDTAIPVGIGDELPDEGGYDGDFFLCNGLLYIWADGAWQAVTAESGPPVIVSDTPPNDPKEGDLWWSSAGDELTLYVYVLPVVAPLADGAAEGDWVPASPPVSLDGIEQHTMELEANVQALWKSSVPFDVFQPYAQKIDLLETELDKLEGVFIDVDLTYKFGYAPQRAPEPGAAYLRYGDDNSSQKPTYEQSHYLNVSQR